MYAKQGRLTQFRTKAERDAFLWKEINSIKTYRTTLAHDLEEMRDGIGQERERLDQLEEREQALTAEMNGRKEKIRNLGDDVAKWKEEQSEKMERRK